MTALGKLFRTTAFKLSLAYLVIFALGAGLVLGWVSWNVKRLVDEQIAQTVEAEISGLAEQYSQGGIRRLVDSVQRRTGQPGSSLYLVTNFAGETIAGNVAVLPAGVLQRPGLVEMDYERAGDTTSDHRALARIFLLPGGFRLLVGRDLADRETLRKVMGRALVTSLVWLTAIGTFGGLLVARRVLRRVDAMSASSQSIMTGDLSRRLPRTGTGDELDRLAQNLNAMLERIAELMAGLREVSDNIAHDLKTPLTRLRNGAEQALRLAGSPADYRLALEKTIAESDGLIRVFDALLVIARVEAGAERIGMAQFDVADVARNVAELYEPLSEEQGMELSISIESGLNLHGNRELIGQAVANLIDNALKYGCTPASTSDVPAIGVSARRVDADVEIAVTDRGPGISAGDRGRVVNRFVRLENSRSHPGSGLGLSLVAAVCRLHHGALRIEDNMPGLRAVISLPALPAPSLPAGSPALVASAPHLTPAQ